MAMSLRGDLRESISLEDDEDSDVEDEVFIRDGKHGYKLAEEINMKRPLMAPRRRARGAARGTMGGVAMKFSENGECKVTGWKLYWKPCCYVWAALVVLIGLIAVVVVLVSIHPLPLGSFGSWRNLSSTRATTKASEVVRARKRPCSDLKVTEVWTATLPDLDADSSLRSLDVNGDGVGDVLFGFGTDDGGGGVSALDGNTGKYIWRRSLNDSIYSLQCNHDVTGDRLPDCLAVGEGGTVLVLDPINGTIVWIRTKKESDGAIPRALYVANLIDDADGDGIADVLATRSSLGGPAPSSTRLLLFSGKDGTVLGNMALAPGANNSSTRSFYMPQIVRLDDTTRAALLGTGVPGSKGELIAIPLEEVMGRRNEHFNTTKLSEGGAYVTPGVLVDVTVDGVDDVVVVGYDARLQAVDVTAAAPKWEYATSGVAESALPPCPAYFNGDDVADFLMMVRRRDEILNASYTQAYMVDGRSGRLVYEAPAENVAYDQMAALSISSEGVGNDLFLFWISDPKCATGSARCRPRLKLTALSEFHQPPGIVLFDTSDFSPGPPEAPPTAAPATTASSAPSAFEPPPPSRYQWEEGEVEGGDPLYVDYQSANQDDGEEEWAGKWAKKGRYLGRKRGGVDEVRDPRGDPQVGGFDDVENVESARYRLMHDLERLPNEILQENLQQRGKKKRRRRRRGRKLVAGEKERPISLWDLESEREATEKKRGKQDENRGDGLDFEGKRESVPWGAFTDGGSFKVASVGIVLDPLPVRKPAKRATEAKMATASKIVSKSTSTSDPDKMAAEEATTVPDDDVSAVDVVIALHWLPDKMATEGELDNRGNVKGPRQGSLMFVRRMRVECACAKPVQAKATNQVHGKLGGRIFERCARFLPEAQQRWNQYLGRYGNGTFTHGT